MSRSPQNTWINPNNSGHHHVDHLADGLSGLLDDGTGRNLRTANSIRPLKTAATLAGSVFTLSRPNTSLSSVSNITSSFLKKYQHQIQQLEQQQQLQMQLQMQQQLQLQQQLDSRSTTLMAMQAMRENHQRQAQSLLSVELQKTVQIEELPQPALPQYNQQSPFQQPAPQYRQPPQQYQEPSQYQSLPPVQPPQQPLPRQLQPPQQPPVQPTQQLMAHESHQEPPEEPDPYMYRRIQTPGQSKSRIPVQYHRPMLNIDQRGDDGRYKKNKGICYEFQSNGQCDRGDKCRFFHDDTRYSNPGEANLFQKPIHKILPKKGKPRCRDYKRGNCRRGESCRFIHE